MRDGAVSERYTLARCQTGEAGRLMRRIAPDFIGERYSSLVQPKSMECSWPMCHILSSALNARVFPRDVGGE
jgi:hypothetical protein